MSSKFEPWWNLLKIGIWDLQASYNIVVRLVCLDPVSPYPKHFETLRVQ